MNLAIILESIPWCHLVVGILFPGFRTKIHPTYFMLIVFASAFRILVTFALVLEVHGITFFQIPWTTYGSSSSSNHKITTRVLLMSPPFYNVNLPVLPFLHGLSGRNMLNSFNMLTYASTTQKIICSFELSLLVVLWPSYINCKSRVVVHSSSSMPITLVVRQVILFWND